MKVFITGGTGFIGRYLIRRLIQRGDQVYALARSEQSAAVLRGMGAMVVPGDVTDRESMRDGMDGSDIVYHVAAIYDFSPDSLRQAEAINVAGTRNVLELAYELGIPKIVYTSTVAVFGDTRGQLPDETYYAEGPFLSEYERTKWKAHYEVAIPLIEQGAPIIIVMPGAVYGPGDTSWLGEIMRLFYRGLLPVLPGPDSVITYAHVDDIAEGHMRAAERGRIGESYILAGPAVPLGEMLEFWSQLTGKPAPVVRLPSNLARSFAPVAGRFQPALSLPTAFSEGIINSLGATFAGRSDKARAELGWRTRPLQAGMMETFEWIAATEPANAGVRERQAIKGLLLAAAGFLLFWLWRRHHSRSKSA